MESRMRCTATKVSLPTGEELLLVEIAVDCPACGQYTVRFAGHHLRMIRDALIEVIDLHPGLTGHDSDVKILDHHRFGTPGPDDSSRN